jgi:hypothetical protein
LPQLLQPAALSGQVWLNLSNIPNNSPPTLVTSQLKHLVSRFCFSYVNLRVYWDAIAIGVKVKTRQRKAANIKRMKI